MSSFQTCDWTKSCIQSLGMHRASVNAPRQLDKHCQCEAQLYA